MFIYAGIGSRHTPSIACEILTQFARAAANSGAILRTGGALGADKAFMDGCAMTEMELYLPWQGYNGYRGVSPTPRAMDMAKGFCGAAHWARCSQAAKKMHARNMQIILGKDLDDPVAFVMCWTPNGRIAGVTGVGIRCAVSHSIKVYNLGLRTSSNGVYAFGDIWGGLDRATTLQSECLKGLRH